MKYESKISNMEKIIFRGQRIDNGELVAGNYFHWVKRGKKIPIIGEGIQNGSVMGYEVNPLTIRTYTGYNDMNKKPIFGGDIVEYGTRNRVPYYAEVWYDSKNLCWIFRWVEDGEWNYAPFIDEDGEKPREWCKIEGNVFQNIELMELHKLEEE